MLKLTNMNSKMESKWFSVSNAYEISCEYKWIVKNLSSLKSIAGTSELIESSKFYIKYHQKKLNWSLRFVHTHRDLFQYQPQFTDFELMYHESIYIPNSIIDIELSVVDNKNNKIQFARKITTGPINTLNTKVKCSIFMDSQSLNKVVKNMNNELHLICKFNLMTDRTNTKSVEMPKFVIPRSQLVTDFDKLINDKNYGDFDIIVGKRVFRVHKGILAVRSPVLSAMFETNMTENKDNRVEIKDITPEIFVIFLRFIYTDEIPNISDSNVAKKLLIAADKYALDRLKVICESILIKEVNFDNAIEYLLFTEFYNAERLKKCVKDFINLYGYDAINAKRFNSKRCKYLFLYPIVTIVGAVILATVSYKLFTKKHSNISTAFLLLV